jgi:CRP-like cAMP-binding protein
MEKRRRSPIENEQVETAQCSDELRFQIVRALPFLRSLDDREILSASAQFREKGYEAGQTIYSAGFPAAHLYLVAAGKVKLIQQTAEGRSVVLDVLGLGEFFGHLSGSNQDRYQHSARALGPTCALVMSGRDFRRILNKHPAVAIDVLNVVAARLEFAQDTIRSLSSDPVEKRVASVLLRLGEKFGRRKDVGLLIELPLSREDLADMSGTTTETASRIVSALHRQGLIRAGRRWIAIVEPARLERVSGIQPR